MTRTKIDPNTMLIRTITLHCKLGCGDIPFSPLADETHDEALARHYQAPIHHHNHVWLEGGSGCPCGIHWMIEPLFSESYTRKVRND